MEFRFQISSCQDPALDAETAELLRQRLEDRSRQAVPGMWRVTDQLNARADSVPDWEKRRRRYRIYGGFLLVLGLFALVPGLMEPRTPSLIGAGLFALLAGAAEFCLAGAKKTLVPPASCRREAAELLRTRRETDWEKLQVELRFNENGWSVTTAEGESQTSYEDLRGVFETERLWMLVYGKDLALLLQKKDLISGEAGEFLPYLQEKIAENHVS